MEQTKEFKLKRSDFDRLTKLVYDQTGIVLKESKRDMVYGRLARRLRELRLSTFSAYLERLEKGGAEEGVDLVNAITTNLTRFFREDHHFEHMAKAVFEPSGNSGQPLLIWSAGCSTGQEPYSVALQALASFGSAAASKVKILATDIDTGVLDKARNGIYPVKEAKGIPAAMRRHIAKGPEGSFTMGEAVRKLTHFRQLNLIGPWPMRAKYDAIMCRNVLIYFDKETQTKLVDRYLMMLKPGGFLYLGHSESMAVAAADIETVGRSIFRKPAQSQNDRRVA